MIGGGGLQAANMAKAVIARRDVVCFTEEEVEKNFQQEVNTYARRYSFLTAVLFVPGQGTFLALSVTFCSKRCG